MINENVSADITYKSANII